MGRYVVAQGLGAGMEIRGAGHGELDITREGDVLRVLDETRPDWVINAAACARMEQCAAEPEKTRRLNAEAPAWLARLGREKGFRLCHVSSDYIFDGKAREPYGEEAPPSPLSEYARQKAAADAEVSKYPEHLILRVAWLFGRGGGTFMSKMPELMMERSVLQVATGRRGNCLYMGTGAGWVLELVERGAGGIFNFVHPDETTWEEFARFTLAEMGRRGMAPQCERIETVPMSGMAALQEPRPEYTGLSVAKLERVLGRPLEGWRTGVCRFLDEKIAG